MTHNRMILEACRARKASHTYLGFNRVDSLEIDTPEWDQWLIIKQVEGKAVTRKLPLDHHGDLKKNYEEHCG